MLAAMLPLRRRTAPIAASTDGGCVLDAAVRVSTATVADASAGSVRES
jgi:hypothetical protein